MKSLPLSENRYWEAGFYGILFRVKTFLSKISNLCEFQVKKKQTENPKLPIREDPFADICI